MRKLDDEHTGRRIAEERKRAGYTQRELAARLPYSYSLLRQVEEGHKSASPDFVSAVARALHLDVTALTGQPYVTELQKDRLDTLIRPIREALDLYDLGLEPHAIGKDVTRLISTADELCRLVRATRLNQAAGTLPHAISELTAACHGRPSTELWTALASTYRTAHDIAVKLGFYDLATVALDRMDWASQRASDPLLAAMRQYMRALVYFREGEHTIGLRLIGIGHRLISPSDSSIEALAVAGQLHLGASVIAARAHDASAVKAHLAEAKALSTKTGEAGHIHWLSFGPTNVAVHDVSAQVEMRKYGKAVIKAKDVSLPTAWATSRRAHFFIDRARAEMEIGKTDAALSSLVTARSLAPQQTRYHPGARETIKGLVLLQRRTPDTLNHMAAWVGL
ncbi:helix-turn-helix transcriptional regulator [Streptomyces sp. NPDC026206]|uniref:helix-turn-helix domain-containing protein n=1 Tax=Streptomyces sp. NPDC026206 TaxID=3157089 RepID=UPI0033DE3078